LFGQVRIIQMQPSDGAKKIRAVIKLIIWISTCDRLYFEWLWCACCLGDQELWAEGSFKSV